MPEPITAKTLDELRAQYPNDRLEHLVHPDEPQFEIVVKTPRLDAFRAWKRELADLVQRGESVERLMEMCVVYPTLPEWDAMLDRRAALADTFGGDIPRLVGATERSAVCNDLAVLGPLEEKYGKGELQHLRHPEYRDCEIVIKRPSRGAWKSFNAMRAGKAKGITAYEQLLVDCVIPPFAESWKEMVERMPGLVDTFGSAAATFAGASAAFTVKK
jgi:hypothetical protein